MLHLTKLMWNSLQNNDLTLFIVQLENRERLMAMLSSQEKSDLLHNDQFVTLNNLIAERLHALMHADQQELSLLQRGRQAMQCYSSSK